MINSFLGIKIKQTRQFDEKGEQIPITKIKTDPCTVVQIKSLEKDGYHALQLGLGSKKEKHLTRPLLGHFKKAGLEISPRFLKEVRLIAPVECQPGSQIKVGEVFQKGDKINVTGISKGKGFAGVVKRWGFAGGPRTHGQSDRERAPGSIGATTTPGRVLKGKKMAGHMGFRKTTVRNLEVIDVDSDQNELIVKGLVPGPAKGLLMIAKPK